MGKYSFTEKKCVVTGASSGIGKEISHCLAKEGVELFLTCHPLEEKELLEWCNFLRITYNVGVDYHVCDLSEDSSPENLYNKVLEKFSKTDILVNCAGIIAHGHFYEIPLSKQIKILEINGKASMSLMYLFLNHMKENGGGKILNISSASAFQPTVNHAVYGATKAFIQNLSEAVAYEARKTGVVISTLNPSYTDTPMLKGENFPEKLFWYKFSGIATPEKIAQKAVSILRKRSTVLIPGLFNKFVHLFLPRILPRKVGVIFSDFMLKK